MLDHSKNINKSKVGDDSVPTFIRKTYEILEEKKFPEIIDWNAEGSALIIKQPTEFCQKVLPLYFKHNNLTSFIRQLNMYNFHKRRTQDVDHIYFHELFQRDKKEFLKDIKRKSNDHMPALKTIETQETTSNFQENVNFLQENETLKRINQGLVFKLSLMEKKLKESNARNLALRQRIIDHSEREEIMKDILTNLMKQFNVCTDQLPSLMKSYPLPYRQNSLKLYQTHENYVNHDYQDQAYSPQGMGAFLETSSTEASGEELKHSVSQDLGSIKESTKVEELMQIQPTRSDPEYWRAEMMTAPRGNFAMYEGYNYPNPGVFQKTFDPYTSEERGNYVKRELSESFLGGLFLKVQKTLTAQDEDSKLVDEELKFVRKDEEMNPAVDLLNFTVS